MGRIGNPSLLRFLRNMVDRMIRRINLVRLPSGAVQERLGAPVSEMQPDRKHWPRSSNLGESKVGQPQFTSTCRDCAQPACAPQSARGPRDPFGSALGGRHGTGIPIRLQHLLVPHLGSLGNVDVCGLHDARVRFGADQERFRDLPEEHRPLLHRRPHVFHHRLQSDVCGCRWVDRQLRVLLRFIGRGSRAAWRRSGCRRSRPGPGLLQDVRVVLPDGVRGDHRVHRLRNAGGAGPAVVLLCLHRRADRGDLPHRRRLDLGHRLVGWRRRLAGGTDRHRLQGFRRLDHRPLHRGLGGSRRCPDRRTATRQVPCRWHGQTDRAVQHSHRHPGRVHPLARDGSVSTAVPNWHWEARPMPWP